MPIPVSASIEGDPNPGAETGTYWCWTTTIAGCTNSTAPIQMQPAGTQTPRRCGTLPPTSSVPTRGLRPTPRGLPIFPGLARYDEVAAGQIHHALRFTLQSSRAAFVPPASHWAANSSNALAAPMGMRLRLKASFDISSFSAANQVILTALKKYGMIMADNGSSMYISGAPDDNWNNSDLHNLGSVTAADFDVVEMNPIYTVGERSGGRAHP